MIIADTDVLIDFLANRGTADRVAEEINQGNLATTVVTRIELLVGARDSLQQRMVLDLLDLIPTLPLDQAAANRAVALRILLEEAGTPIRMADYLIAGIALQHRAPLLTRNTSHFRRIAHLTLVETNTQEPSESTRS